MLCQKKHFYQQSMSCFLYYFKGEKDEVMRKKRKRKECQHRWRVIRTIIGTPLCRNCYNCHVTQYYENGMVQLSPFHLRVPSDTK